MENHSDHEDEAAHKEEKKEEVKNEVKGIIFKKIFVKTGISDDSFIEVSPFNEIKDGEEVVSKGTFYLKSEMKKEELSGHEH